MGFAIARISNAVSYLSDDPTTCVNCHVMGPQFATWQHSSHRRVATCTDCHVPHDNVLRKYMFKASDGMRHAYVFTFRLEPQVIQIRDAGKAAVQENCVRCHAVQVSRVGVGEVSLESARHGEGLLCWECHRETPHGRANSLASTPHARVPRLTPVAPRWMAGLNK
jgi:cytochrome c nitrite reductase small subunit